MCVHVAVTGRKQTLMYVVGVTEIQIAITIERLPVAVSLKFTICMHVVQSFINGLRT